MQSCPNCGKDNPDHGVFCEYCGFAIRAVSIGTTQLNANNLPAGGGQLADDYVIILHVEAYDDPVPLRVLDHVVLGREEGSDDVATYINLEPYGALNAGVSRRHAQFSRREDELLVRDLGSTNGTFLNGQRLIDARDYSVHDGDELVVGRLSLRVFFK